MTTTYFARYGATPNEIRCWDHAGMRCPRIVATTAPVAA